MSSVFADFFAAGAQSRDLGAQDNFQVDDSVVVGFEHAVVLLHAFQTRNRGLLSNEERELDFEEAVFGVQFFSQLREDSGDAVDAYLALIFTQHFQESAHVRAFHFGRQAHGESKISDRMLALVRSIKNHDGMFHLFHPDLLDRNVAVVWGFLNVGQRDAQREIAVIGGHDRLVFSSNLGSRRILDSTMFGFNPLHGPGLAVVIREDEVVEQVDDFIVVEVCARLPIRATVGAVIGV